MSELAISIAVNVLLGFVLLALLYRRRADGLRLSGPDEAMEVFRRRFPDAQGEATVSSDGRAALIELGQDVGIGMLECQGHRWNARVLAPGEVCSVQFRSPDLIDIGTADFGWPRSRVRIAEAAGRAKWIARLGAISLHGGAGSRPGMRHA